MDMLTPRSTRGGHPVDFDDKLEEAERELERIQQEREELARKKRELDELNARRRTFIAQQNELAEKLGGSLTKIDRTLFELREEAEDLEQCRSCFAAHLDKLEKINPDQWGAENLSDRLQRATLVLDAATDDFDSAAAHFSNNRSGAIFGQPSKRTRAKRGLPSEFAVNLRNGFAFNLPVIVLGVVALLVYLTR
jgi:DNA repair exonuclease SbcCD ATPase subunit